MSANNALAWSVRGAVAAGLLGLAIAIFTSIGSGGIESKIGAIFLTVLLFAVVGALLGAGAWVFVKKSDTGADLKTQAQFLRSGNVQLPFGIGQRTAARAAQASAAKEVAARAGRAAAANARALQKAKFDAQTAANRASLRASQAQAAAKAATKAAAPGLFSRLNPFG